MKYTVRQLTSVSVQPSSFTNPIGISFSLSNVIKIPNLFGRPPVQTEHWLCVSLSNTLHNALSVGRVICDSSVNWC